MCTGRSSTTTSALYALDLHPDDIFWCTPDPWLGDRNLPRHHRPLSWVEQIKKFVIVPDEWSPTTGQVTPSLKVKRTLVLEKYQQSIEKMYRE